MREPIQLSELSFGCASIMGKVGKNKAMQSMSEAFDLGVTHFDVARSYGFGQAEQVVGDFIKGRRDKVTVTSKFGVVPPHLSLRTKAAIPVARLVAKYLPYLRTRLKYKSGQLLAERNFDVDYARKCLDKSLTALATDYIDIYLLHEPVAALLENSEELFDFLENSVHTGKIRRWGIAYQSTQDYEWATVLGGDIIQFEGNIKTLPLCCAISDDKRQRIVTRPFIGGFAEMQVLQATLHDLGLTALVQQMGASLADVSLCLAHILAGQSGTVLCSMFSSKHIQKNVHALNQLASDPLMKKVISTIMQSTHQSTLQTKFRI